MGDLKAPQAGQPELISLPEVLVWVDSALRAEREAVSRLLDSQHAAIRGQLESKLICGYGYSTNEAAQAVTDTSADELEQETTKDQVAMTVPGEPKSELEQAEPTQTKASIASQRPVRIRTPDVHPHVQSLRNLGTSNKITELVTKTRFEVSIGILIIANAVILCLETQYKGFDIGYEMGLNQTGTGPMRPAREVWPGAKGVFDALDVVFGLAFTLELALKVMGIQYLFFRSFFNWFDLAVVASWWVGKLGDAHAVGNLTILRLIRLVRLLRPLRLVRSMVMFDTLHVLVGALSSSIYVLGWSLVLVLLVLMTMAIFMNAMLESYMLDLANGDKGVETYKYFGSFSNSVITMFEVTFGNWVPVCRHLYGHIDEWYGVFTLVYRFGIGFACITVIRAVFILETFRAANSDNDLMIMQKQRQMQRYAAQMDLLFKETDTSGDGFLSWDEFQEVLYDPRVKSWLGSMELEVGDVPLLFGLTDANVDGVISGPELVHGFARLKGAARSIDVLKLERDIRRIENLEGNVLGKLDTLLAKDADTETI